MSFDLPIPMLQWCPECGERHIDVGDFATKPHHTHACQHCGHCWRPAVVPTCGVQVLPSFKNDDGGTTRRSGESCLEVDRDEWAASVRDGDEDYPGEARERREAYEMTIELLTGKR